MTLTEFNKQIAEEFAYTAPEVINDAPVYVEINGELRLVKRLDKTSNKDNRICMVISI